MVAALEEKKKDALTNAKSFSVSTYSETTIVMINDVTSIVLTNYRFSESLGHF